MLNDSLLHCGHDEKSPHKSLHYWLFYFVLFPFFSFLGVRNVDFSNSGKYIIALFTDSNSTISIYETATQNLGEIVIPNYVIVLFFVSNCIIWFGQFSSILYPIFLFYQMLIIQILPNDIRGCCISDCHHGTHHLILPTPLPDTHTFCTAALQPIRPVLVECKVQITKQNFFRFLFCSLTKMKIE